MTKAATASTPPLLPAPPAGFDLRRQAKFLYWMQWRLTDIADYQGVPESTVRAWKARDKWDEAPVLERIEGATEARYVALVIKEVKSGSDYKEIDLLGRQIERFARVRRYEAPGGHEGDLNPNVGARNAGPKKKPVRNHFTEEQALKLRELFFLTLFDYQKFWAAAGMERTRVILKSRQIGATYYFAREALLDAVETGRNQIFLSASKKQAHVFRHYIVAFAQEVGVELTGDPIILSNGAELHFLGTNARTAQSYHGNFYFDEFFWTFRFTELNKVASGMASHKKWRKTYFSTPSSVTHEAYSFWTGDDFNRKRPKDQRQDIDVSWRGLQHGSKGGDRRWRQIVTVLDAERAGCTLFDIEELRYENSPDDFANLYLCEFIDDTQSVFPMVTMQRCMVEAFDWDDFNPARSRPFGHRNVWLGYDPSHTGDSAALVVIEEPPIRGQSPFRILEKFQFKGMDFADQAAAIERITKRYNVTYIGIDTTGMGQGVYQLVLPFFPTARAINYSAEVKVGMVLKASDTIRRGRLQYDAGWTDVTQSFMAIRKTITASGRNVTYEAGRTEETGHADLAWAVMHVLFNEPLDAPVNGGTGGRGFLEIYD
jgi:uncharacterized protein YjcR